MNQNKLWNTVKTLEYADQYARDMCSNPYADRSVEKVTGTCPWCGSPLKRLERERSYTEGGVLHQPVTEQCTNKDCGFLVTDTLLSTFAEGEKR